ncbi:type II toxin-antitoxin system Phd/YefM family antitoxin [Halomonas daqiaonensis]|uniref:Prevent-host-death family protein n=1 Tax=Halomonas daqiaonensis TaxID=650850 RepID=A0A1H7VP35_9GAMM|nr:type II toxin-antitoxin system prevent-host-death family antitoxin [Halomonas daqiaonensis]SEM11033.1 prevent-host-death family protein [Halomonas daqiaonensis]
MHATVKDLRLQARALLAATQRGEVVEITLRGKPCARLVGLAANQAEERPSRNPAFGLWADREEMDVDAEVRRFRASRTFGIND